jgi:transcription-repair coupling factor (superfamily II helicase)
VVIMIGEDIGRRLRGREWFAGLLRQLRESGEVEVGGAWATSGLLVAAEVAREVAAPLLVITPEEEAAESTVEDLRTLTGADALRFPAWEELPSADEPVDASVFAERLRVLRVLLEAPAPPQRAPGCPAEQAGRPMRALVASVEALLQPVIRSESLRQASLQVQAGRTLPREALLRWLAEREFEVSPAVEGPGEYSVRGGIVDVFPIGAEQPLRIEYFGDTVESIRGFDVGTQRSTEEVPSATILGITRRALAQAETSEPSSTLFAYLPEGFLVVFLEPIESQERARSYLEMEAGTPGLHTFAEVWQHCARFRRLLLYRFRPAAKEAVDLGVRPLPFEGRDANRLVTELVGLAKELRTVVVVCGNQAEAKRLSELVSQQEEDGKAPGSLHFVEGRLSQGFLWPALALAVVPHHELFHRYV